MEGKKNTKIKKRVRKIKKSVKKEANRIALGNECKDLENDKGLGLARFSYADFVVLSSVIAYGIVDSVDQNDLGIILSFLGMITADVAILQTKISIEKAIDEQNQQLANQQDVEEAVIPEQIAEESIIADTTDIETVPFLTTTVLTSNRNSKSKYIKKKKRIKKIKKVKKR